MNDRADLCLAANYDGLHVGQDDLSPEGARRVIGPELLLGVSSHNPEQIEESDTTTADYIAIGPVFVTTSKEQSGSSDWGRRSAPGASADPQAAGSDRRDYPGKSLRSHSSGRGFSVAVLSLILVRDPRKSAEEFFRI